MTWTYTDASSQSSYITFGDAVIYDKDKTNLYATQISIAANTPAGDYDIKAQTYAKRVNDDDVLLVEDQFILRVSAADSPSDE